MILHAYHAYCTRSHIHVSVSQPANKLDYICFALPMLDANLVRPNGRVIVGKNQFVGGVVQKVAKVAKVIAL